MTRDTQMQPHGPRQSAASSVNKSSRTFHGASIPYDVEHIEPVHDDSIEFIQVLDPDYDFNTSFDVPQAHPVHNSEGAIPLKLGLPFAGTLLHWWQYQISSNVAGRLL